MNQSFKRNKIGILNDLKWDKISDQSSSKIRSWTEISPDVWKNNIENKIKDIMGEIKVELINVDTDFDIYISILNPYGGVYPEKYMKKIEDNKFLRRYEYETLNKIFEYVDKGGLFVNVSDVPGYYAFNITAGKSFVTSSVDNNFVQRLGLEIIRDVNEKVERYVVRHYEQPHSIKYGKGKFLISSAAVNDEIKNKIVDFIMLVVKESNIDVQEPFNGSKIRTISKLRFENFRGIKKGDIDLGMLTILIGPNNSSKTTILEGLFLLPNPLRKVPFIYSEDLTAAKLVHETHKMLDNKGYLFLFYKYVADEATIEWEYNYLKFIKAYNSIFISYLKDITGKKISWQKGDFISIGTLEIASDQSKAETDNGNKLLTPDSLLISSDFIKFAYSYIEHNWEIFKPIFKKTIKDISMVINEDFIDVILDKISGNFAITGYLSNGETLRLGDLGYGVQTYLVAKLLYEHKKPGILLWDDIESHLNPRVLSRIGEWFSELNEHGVQIVVSTHSLETVKIIAEYNETAKICLTLLENGELKTKSISVYEINELEKAGIDIRLAEGILL